MSEMVDEKLSPRQVKDLLRHLSSQHFDFMTYAHPVIHSKDLDEQAWEHFKSLPPLERFKRISECLNEDIFKMSLILILNSLKSSTCRAINGTFLCLKSHLDIMYNTSRQYLIESKYPKSKHAEVLKLFEFDDIILWDSAKSEWILNNINFRCSFAALYLAGQTKIDLNEFRLIGSSVLIKDVETLHTEVEAVLFDQYRYMQAKLTSTTEVEESLQQLKLGTKDISQISTPGNFTFIAAFSLASLIAQQIRNGVISSYSLSQLEVRTETKKTKSFQRHSVANDTLRDYNLMYLSVQEQSFDQFCSSSVQSWWKAAPKAQKISLLQTLGLIAVKQNPSPLVPRGNRSKTMASPLNINILEDIQLDFTKWYVRLHGLSPETNWMYSPEKKSVENLVDWIDIEAGSDQNRHFFETEISVQTKFIEWSIFQEEIGSSLCEYFAFCPLLKLFPSNISTHFDLGGDNHFQGFSGWASRAFSILEQTYQQQVGDQTIIALFTRDHSRNLKKKNSNPRRKSKEKFGESFEAGDHLIGPKLKDKRLSKSKGSQESPKQLTNVVLEVDSIRNLPPTSETILIDQILTNSSVCVKTQNIFSTSEGDEGIEFDASLQPAQMNQVSLENQNSDSSSEADTQSLEFNSSGAVPAPEKLDENDASQFTRSSLGDCETLTETEFEIWDPKRGTEQSDSKCDRSAPDQHSRVSNLLTQDILDMAGNLHRIAQLRRPWQLAAIERVRVVVQTIWPDAQCEIFGSFGTGLAVPSSDVDIVVSGVANQLGWWGGKPLTPLVLLSQHLQQQEWVNTVQAIEHTAMPVIKLTTAPVPMPCVGAEGRKDYRGVIKMDISISSPSSTDSPLHQSFTLPHSPPHTFIPHLRQVHHHSYTPLNQSFLNPNHGNAINLLYQYPSEPDITQFHSPLSPGIPHQGVSTRDFVLRLCAMNPSIIPLVLVIKQFLQEKGLHDPFTGGLSSYAVTIMMASILQPHALESPETQPDLGTLLLTFFRCFGTSFDTRKYAVVLSINGPFAPLGPGTAYAHVPRVGTPNYWKPPDPVVVTDPLNSQNNLGRSCFGFRQIQTEFDNALERAFMCLKTEELTTPSQDFPSETSMGKIFQKKTKTKSVLGAIFGTTHHDSVVRLQAQIWCPLEEGWVNSESNNSLRAEIQYARTVREECLDILGTLPDEKLGEVKRILLEIQRKNTNL